jgi:hypothetical protein
VAKVLGEVARYVSDQACEKRVKLVHVGVFSVAACGVIIGYALALAMWVKSFPVAVPGLICTVLLILLFAIDRWFMQRYAS